MSNRVTLAQISDMTGEQVSALPADQLAMLLEEAAESKATLKAQEERLYAGLVLRYGPRATEARRVEGKATGRTRIHEGEYLIHADLPKKVEWSQEKLRAAEETIRSWGEQPSDYLTIVLGVAESKFNAWPPTIRQVFEPARTLGVGKQTFAFEKKEAA